MRETDGAICQVALEIEEGNGGLAPVVLVDPAEHRVDLTDIDRHPVAAHFERHAFTFLVLDGANLYSLIETAKANNIEPYRYLAALFKKLPLAQTVDDYEALLPWNLELGGAWAVLRASAPTPRARAWFIART